MVGLYFFESSAVSCLFFLGSGGLVATIFKWLVVLIMMSDHDFCSLVEVTMDVLDMVGR
jgi:hypothetical protein